MAKKSVKLKKTVRYQKRITLFIDFLGFKEHVKKTASDPAFLLKLLRAMDRISEIGEDDKQFRRSQKVTQFSDCVVVSYKVQDESAVFWLLNEIAYCVIDLVEAGFLLRGALTVGDLFHSKKHVVGPALVEAYELESKAAIYPRILIDKKVLQVARKARSEMHSAKEEQKHVKEFMTTDTDGRDYFDYVAWDSVVRVVGGDNDGYPAYLQCVETLLKEGLSGSYPRVLEKYIWLHSKYIAELKKFKDMSADHVYYLENPEFKGFFDEFDEFEAAVKRAHDLIAAEAAKAAKGSGTAV